MWEAWKVSLTLRHNAIAFNFDCWHSNSWFAPLKLIDILKFGSFPLRWQSGQVGRVRVRVWLGQFDLIRLSGYESSRVRSGRVSGLLVSGRFRFRIVSGRVGRLSGHLMSGHFGFRVGSVIESSSVGLFGFWVVSGRVGSVIGSSSVGSFRISDRIRSDRFGYWVI
jgi:hypothetical protein